MIPNLVVTVRGGRAAVIGEPGWISDKEGFMLFLMGAIGAALVNWFLTAFVMAQVFASLPLLITHILLLVLEYVAFRILILGRPLEI